jgi:hypothetical protein
MKKQIISTLSLTVLLSSPHLLAMQEKKRNNESSTLEQLTREENGLQALITEQAKKITNLEALLPKTDANIEKIVLESAKKVDSPHSDLLLAEASKKTADYETFKARTTDSILKNKTTLRVQQERQKELLSRIALLQPSAEFTNNKALRAILPGIRKGVTLKEQDKTKLATLAAVQAYLTMQAIELQTLVKPISQPDEYEMVPANNNNVNYSNTDNNNNNNNNNNNVNASTTVSTSSSSSSSSATSKTTPAKSGSWLPWLW